MGAPISLIKEIDLSTRVPAFPGVFGAIVIPNASKGLVGVPQLMTSESQFLRTYTPNSSVAVGDDLSYFSALHFLRKSNKLWVVRTDPAALTGGITAASGAGTAAALATGVADPAAYTFGANELLLIAGTNPGAWNNDVHIKLYTYAANPDIVKEIGAFQIQVFLTGDLVTPVEVFTCSRVKGAKDGFGKNIYVEDVVLASEYITVVDNVVPANSIVPNEILTPLQMASGAAGTAATDGNMILDLDTFKNKDSYPVTILLDGGRATAAYQQALIAIAEARKDCVAILSVPYAAENAATYLTDINTYRSTTLNANTSFAALYTTHVKIYDKFNDRELWVAPDGVVAAQISETAANQEIWYPVGGFRRGMINVLDVRRRLTQGEMDLLYDKGVNSLRFVPGKGITIWGQKTLSARPSALDRLNVRLMLVVVEPAVQVALEDFIFEINDAATRSLITAMITSYMDNIKSRRGVYDFMVVCDDTNNTAVEIDQNKLNVWLFVKPTKAAEFISTSVVITTTGASFKAAAATLGA